MQQKRIEEPGPVLLPDGSPVAGYSTEELLHYNRKAVKAPPWRIKEWDFYQVMDEEGRFCLQLTYGHASYIGQIGVMLFDIQKKKMLVKKSRLIPLPFGSMHLPSSAARDSRIQYNKRGISLCFETENRKRKLSLFWKDFEARITLTPQIPHAMVINIPFRENPKQFYYNHKINCMRAEGFVRYSTDEEEGQVVFGEDAFVGQLPAYGLLDWGRGVWPFSSEWFWSNGCGLAEGKLLGFNLGCGFGDTSAATENIFFYDGQAYKLGEVVISHQNSFLAPWKLIDREGRCSLTMSPLYDRTTRDKVLFVNNCCHQVFGLFNGFFTLDNGKLIQVKDLPAFAEHAVNNW